MNINELATELGVKHIDDARYQTLKNLNLLEIPGIKRNLTEMEMELGTPEKEIENNIQITETAIKSCLYSNSHHPIAKKLGKKLRQMAVYELYLKHYITKEIAIILRVSPYTIKNDIRAIKKITKREWWS